MVTQTLDQNRGSVWIWLPCVADLFQFYCAAVPVNHCSRQTDTVIILIILHRFPVSLQWRLAGIRSILLCSGTRGPDRRQLWQVEPTLGRDTWPDWDLSIISHVLIHLTLTQPSHRLVSWNQVLGCRGLISMNYILLICQTGMMSCWF